MLVISICK